MRYMNKITNFFKATPQIHHYKLYFPLSPNKVESCVRKVHASYKKKPQAIFVSLNGQSENAQNCQFLYDVFSNAYSIHKIPVYSFLEDKITALTYYVGSSSPQIFANPYCLMGDLGVPTKSYSNIHKLLKYLGIGIEKLGTKDMSLWNKFFKPTAEEKQFTQKWLTSVEANLVKNVSEKRSIPKQEIQNISKIMISPQQALQKKLIDDITTMEEFKVQSFPNHRVTETILASEMRNPQLNDMEVQALLKIKEVMKMPNITLSMKDPLNECVEEFIQILSVRAKDPVKLEELDMMIGMVFEEIYAKLESEPLIM